MEEKTVTCDGDSQQHEDKQKISSTYNNGSDGNHLSAVECLRLKNSLMEILEELKMRRINDKENEERIKKADQEKYDLSRKCEAETQKLNESKEQFQKQIQDAERKYRERLSQTEEQLKQQKVFKDCTEKEINGLKDEIRNLEVVKYTLEKDLKEQERKLQLHVQSSEQHLNQLTETEHRFKALQLQCKQLSEAQAQLEDSVQHAVRHNQALLYVNEHQKCILNEEKHHVSSLQSQLLEVKSHLQKKPDETSLQQYQMEIASLNQKIEGLKAEKESSSKEINECAAKYEKVSQLLQDTHKLLEHQIEIAEIHKKNASQQKTLIQQQQGELAEVKGELQGVKDKAMLLRDQHKEEAEKWRKKTSQLQNELSEIKEDLDEQKKRCADLEDLNTTWSNQNIQLTEQLHFTKEQLNKPRQDQILQTELCLMKMVENESQVEVISTDSSVQTMSVPQRTNSTQTPVPELTVSKTQTNNPALANSSSQTERVEIQSVSVQAEFIKFNSKERLFCQSLSSANRSCKSVGQQSPVEVKTLCSQSNAVTLSDSQTLQSSVSQSDSQLSAVKLSAVISQPMQTEPDQLQNPNCQHTSEYIDLAKTEDVNQRETAQQLPENGTFGENQEKIINRRQVIQSNAIRRQSFQLLENTTSDEDKSIDQVTPVSKGVVDDKTSSICDKSMSTETFKHHSEMETDNLTKELLQNQVTRTEASEASTVQIDVHPTPSLATPIDRDQVSCDGLVVSRQDANDPAIDSTVPNDPDKSCVSPRSPGGSRLKLSLSRPKTLLTTPSLKSKQEDAVGSEACKMSGKQTSSTIEQLDILLNSPMSDNQKDETDAELKEVKGILKGQGNISTRKPVTFGSPLHDIHQLSQTSVESVSHDDGDKDLFSDSDDNDTEDGPSKAQTQVSDKSLPATTLLIDGKRVESSNTLAFCVDDFLPDPSLSRTKTITEDTEYPEDCDLEIATKLNTFSNRELKGRISDTMVSEPSLMGRDTVSVDSGKDNVTVPKTMFPALEIPSAQEMMVSATTLSNQYKRTIDAILNKGKKLKTDK